MRLLVFVLQKRKDQTGRLNYFVIPSYCDKARTDCFGVRIIQEAETSLIILDFIHYVRLNHESYSVIIYVVPETAALVVIHLLSMVLKGKGGGARTLSPIV